MIKETVRAEPLAFILTACNWGAYFLAALIAAYGADGISENEEWRIFIAGWVLIPPASFVAAWLVFAFKRAYCSDLAAFFPLALLANALLWVVYFAYQFSVPWLHSYGGSARALQSLVWLFLIYNACVLITIVQFRTRLSTYRLKWIYLALPFVGLCMMSYFSGIKPLLNGLFVPWVIVREFEQGKLKQTFSFAAGDTVVNQNFKLSLGNIKLVVLSKESVTLQVPILWEVLSGSHLETWHAIEGEWVASDSALVELDSQNFRTKLSVDKTLMLWKKELLAGNNIDRRSALGRVVLHSDMEQYYDRLMYVVIGLAMSFLVLLRPVHSYLKRLPPASWIDYSVLCLIAVTGIDLSYPFEPSHYNFYLGPVNDVLHGKSLLVDVNCQYGVGVIYFLAVIFGLSPLPFNYESFSLLISIISMLQYALLYAVARRIVHSQLIAVAVLAVMLVGNNLSQSYNLPSVGALRFGMAYALLALMLLREQGIYAHHSRIMVHILVGISSLWSFETFVYTVTAYLCSELFVHARCFTNPKQGIKSLISSLALSVAAIAVCHITFSLFTYLRADTWPQWNHYFEYIGIYSVGEFGQMTIPGWSPWIIFIAIYFMSLSALAYRALFIEESARAAFAFIAGLTGFGIAQFTYFLGRSHVNNLYHIAIPPILIAFYWCVLIWRKRQNIMHGFNYGAAYCATAMTLVLLIEVYPRIEERWPRTALFMALNPDTTVTSPWSASASDSEVAEAIELIERYAADRERIALFLAPNKTTEALRWSNKAHIFPMSHPEQDGLAPSVYTRVMSFDHGLRAGDSVFLTRDMSVLNPIQQKVIDRLNSQFSFDLIDSTDSVYTFRIASTRTK